MRKFLTHLGSLAIALVMLASVASAAILTCPQDFATWRTGNTFAGGYQGLCSYYTHLSADGKAEFKSEGILNNSGFVSELPKEVWSAIFLAEDWTNGDPWSARIEK